MTGTASPLDPLKAVAEQRRVRIEAHDAYRNNPQFEGAMGRVDALISDYGLALNAVGLMATQWPTFYDRLITLLRIKQQLVECVISTGQSITEVLHTPACRELRFLLETSIKTTWRASGGRLSSDYRRSAGPTPSPQGTRA